MAFRRLEWLGVYDRGAVPDVPPTVGDDFRHAQRLRGNETSGTAADGMGAGGLSAWQRFGKIDLPGTTGAERSGPRVEPLTVWIPGSAGQAAKGSGREESR